MAIANMHALLIAAEVKIAEEEAAEAAKKSNVEHVNEQRPINKITMDAHQDQLVSPNSTEDPSTAIRKLSCVGLAVGTACKTEMTLVTRPGLANRR